MALRPLPADVRIGHVHLRVSDLERATAFYRDVLGFHVVVDGLANGLPLSFLAAGAYHHHIALNTWHSRGGTPPPPGHTGLDHTAILYPNRAALADAVARLFANDYYVDDAHDHGTSVSVYLHDPDGNSIELYYDRPRWRWFDEHGQLIIKNERLRIAEFLSDTRHLAPQLTSTLVHSGERPQ